MSEQIDITHLPPRKRAIVQAIVDMGHRHPLRLDALFRRHRRGHLTLAQLGDEALRWAAEQPAD